MNTQKKVELVNELLPIVNSLKSEQNIGKILAIKEISKSDLMKFSISELQQLQKEIEALQKVKETQQRAANYNELNANSEKPPYKIIC